MSDDPLGARLGFHGKLPSRGDFVRAGLSRALVSAWDKWLERAWPTAAALSKAWSVSPSGVPGWRLALAVRVCGPAAVSGVMLPSNDRVGRRFPLLLAVEGATADARLLDAMERVGRDAINDGHDPDRLRVALAGLRMTRRTSSGEWQPRVRLWRENAGRRENVTGDELPDGFPFFS